MDDARTTTSGAPAAPASRARLGLVTDLADRNVREVGGRAVLMLGDGIADVDAAIRDLVTAGWVAPELDDHVYVLTGLGREVLEDGLP
jgi:hypothetical protein